ncbi:hypothetical protein RIF29_07807 [Crotalaria pallida]|uniref:Uncharacterized protein n=1 Tax=Crotalaria pallida TaxID=3830 RepID=A0AAN9J4H5_CROPI
MKTLNSHLGSSSSAAPSLSLGPAAALPPPPRESHHRRTNRCRTAEKTIAPLSAPCVVSRSCLFEPNREPHSASLALPLLANREISPSWLAPLSLCADLRGLYVSCVVDEGSNRTVVFGDIDVLTSTTHIGDSSHCLDRLQISLTP